MSRLACALALVGTVAAVGLGVPVNAEAGDRKLALVIVPMHDTAAADAKTARRCYSTIKKILAADYTLLSRQTPANLVRRLGLSDAHGWETWSPETLRRFDEWRPTNWKEVVSGEVVTPGYAEVPDAVVLIDCHPEEQRLTVVMHNTVLAGTQRLALTHVSVSDPVVALVAEHIMTHGWRGFSP